MSTTDELKPTCPRCGEQFDDRVFARSFGYADGAQMKAVICLPCHDDECYRDAHGEPFVPVSDWPTPRRWVVAQ